MKTTEPERCYNKHKRMKTRLNRDISHLQVLFVIIGLLFAGSTGLFLVANWDKLPEYYGEFGGSLEEICADLAPFLTGFMALLYLVPMILGAVIEKLSAKLFEFLVAVSRAIMYFPLAPFIAVLAVFALYMAIIDQSLLIPKSFSLTDICGYLFYMLFYVEAVLLFVIYHRSHNIGTKR